MNRLAVACCVLVVSPFFAAPAPAFRSVAVGDKVPAVTVKDMSGRDVGLDFGKRATVLLFWRADQPFSEAALKDLEQIKQEFSPRSVEIFAVAEGGTPTPAVQAALKKLGLTYPMYLDSEHRVEEKLGVIVFPSTGIVVFGRQLKFYLPSRNSNYRQIILTRLKVELGLMSEKEFDQQMKQIGEELGSERIRAEDHFKTGLRLSRQGKSKDAVSELRQALSLDPALIDVHLALGYAHLDLAEPAVAQKEFELVLKRHAASPAAKLGLGISAVRLGNVDRGIEILKDAVQINPDPVQGYYELGRAYEIKGNLKEAMHAYKWAVRKLLQGRR